MLNVREMGRDAQFADIFTTHIDPKADNRITDRHRLGQQVDELHFAAILVNQWVNTRETGLEAIADPDQQVSMLQFFQLRWAQLKK